MVKVNMVLESHYYDERNSFASDKVSQVIQDREIKTARNAMEKWLKKRKDSVLTPTDQTTA